MSNAQTDTGPSGRNPCRSLAGRVALITGATRGIGKSIALALSSESVSCMLVGRNSSHLNDTKAAIEERGGKAEVFPCDLTSPSMPLRTIEKTVETMGRLDILINNAGMGMIASIEETSEEQWDTIMTINAKVPFLMCKEAIPVLRQSGAASIINISSVVGRKGYEEQGAYGASKHALMGFTKVLARELHRDGIRVHIIAPGGTATEMIYSMRPDIPREDLIQPEEIADIVLFLLTRRGNSAIDEINLRRSASKPWQ